MKLDLKDAYYAVPVNQDHRRYLRFCYQGTLYEFWCLPFDLLSAPRAFTKLLKPVATLLRSMGIRIVIYPGRHLTAPPRPGGAGEDLQQGVGTSTEFRVHYQVGKMLLSSHSEPCLFGGSPRLSGNVNLPSEKLDAIIKTAREILKDGAVTYKVLSSFLGRLSHVAQTGVWTAPLHYRSIQQRVRMTCQPSRWPTAARVFLLQKSIEELTWWQSPEVQVFNGQPLQLPAFDMTISTDTSLLVGEQHGQGQRLVVAGYQQRPTLTSTYSSSRQPF